MLRGLRLTAISTAAVITCVVLDGYVIEHHLTRVAVVDSAGLGRRGSIVDDEDITQCHASGIAIFINYGDAAATAEDLARLDVIQACIGRIVVSDGGLIDAHRAIRLNVQATAEE